MGQYVSRETPGNVTDSEESRIPVDINRMSTVTKNDLDQLTSWGEGYDPKYGYPYWSIFTIHFHPQKNDHCAPTVKRGFEK